MSPELKKYLPPPDLISEYNFSTLRFIRSNYEIMIVAWSERLNSKVLPKYVDKPIIKVTDSHNELLGLDCSLQTTLFTFVEKFTIIINIVVAGLPLGLNPERPDEDRLYKLDQHEVLFDALLYLMGKVRDNLHAQ